MHTIKFTILSFLVLFHVSLLAQKVTVKNRDEKVNGDTAEGFATELEGKKEEVTAAWNKFLRDFGKSKQGLVTVISQPTLGGTAYKTGVLYANVKGSGETAEVWLGIKEAEWQVNDISIVKKDIEKEVYQFGVKFYKDKIQAQIDEAVRAFDATTRQQQRITNQTKDLTIQLGNNEQEKTRLDKAIEVNALEHAVLLQKIENNKLAQDSIAQAGEQIKKVIEMHKERQKKVN